MTAPVTSVWDVLVVGGGPSGMLAAARAAERGARVLLLEKNSVLGRKLVITGGGRCNVTNATFDRHVLTARYGEHGSALHALFARFGPDDTRALLRRFGLETKVEAEQRVFPVTDSAHSVRAVLERYMTEQGVVVRRGVTVAALHRAGARDGVEATPSAEGAGSAEAASSAEAGGADTRAAGAIDGVVTSHGEIIRAREIILATGGASRPDTGSTGDAFPWLRTLGLPVREPEASLVPLRVPEQWVRSLQGVALPTAALHVEQVRHAGPAPAVTDRSFWGNARRVASREGKLLFTHFGLSGPLALNMATTVARAAGEGPIRLIVDPLPGVDIAELDAGFREAASHAGKRIVKSLLAERVPARLVPVIATLAGVDLSQRTATLSRVARRNLVETLKGMPCTFGGLMGQEKAVVSSGGLHPDAIDFRTMRLRAYPNVAVLGDLIDLERQSGGYSLQVCWASAWVSAEAFGQYENPLQ